MAPRPITIFGNITHDPELRETNGTARTTFTVAQNHRRYNRDTQQWEDAGADFYPVTAWGALAEELAGVLTKGAPVIVAGTIKSRRVTDQDTGQNRTFWDVTADQVGQRIVPNAHGGENSQGRGNYSGGFGNSPQNGSQQGFGGGGFGQQQADPFGDAGAPPF